MELDDTLVCQIGENDDGMLINLTTGRSFLAPFSKSKHISTAEIRSPCLLNMSDKVQEMNECRMFSSPLSKRARLSMEVTGDPALAHAQLTDDWETQRIAIESRINQCSNQVEAYDKNSLRVKSILESLGKRLRRSAASSLPFTKDMLKNSEEIYMDFAPKHREVIIQASSLSDEEKAETARLKKQIEEQQNLLIEKDHELETVRRTIQQKEIGFAAATALLGISFEECVRKSTEAQAARLANKAPATSTALVSLVPSVIPDAPTPQVAPLSVVCTTPVASSAPKVQPSTTGCGKSTKDETSNSADLAQSTAMGVNTGMFFLPAGCKIDKDEYSRRNRRSVDGIYEGAFPLRPEVLQCFAMDNNAADFVRLLLEHCFTDEFLLSTTVKRMNVVYSEAIIDATMAHFREFRTRKDTLPQPLNRVTVEQFMSRVIQNRKAAAKRRNSK